MGEGCPQECRGALAGGVSAQGWVWSWGEGRGRPRHRQWVLGTGSEAALRVQAPSPPLHGHGPGQGRASWTPPSGQSVRMRPQGTVPGTRAGFIPRGLNVWKSLQASRRDGTQGRPGKETSLHWGLEGAPARPRWPGRHPPVETALPTPALQPAQVATKIGPFEYQRGQLPLTDTHQAC